MPKAKVKETIGYKIQLQETERDALQLWVTSNAIGNVLNGLGQLAMPFSVALSGILTAWIAKEGADKVWKASKEWADKILGDAVRDDIQDYKDYTNNKAKIAKDIAQKASDENRPLTDKEKKIIQASKPESYEVYKKKQLDAVKKTAWRGFVRGFFRLPPG